LVKKEFLKVFSIIHQNPLFSRITTRSDLAEALSSCGDSLTLQLIQEHFDQGDAFIPEGTSHNSEFTAS
jgi:hypothetical protein